jgi:H+-transporting ATPase
MLEIALVLEVVLGKTTEPVRSDNDEPSIHLIRRSQIVAVAHAESPPEFTTIQQVMAASGAMILAVATGSDGHPHIRGLQSLVEALGDEIGRTRQGYGFR